MHHKKRDDDHRDEDQRLGARHAPHRAPAFVYWDAHNLTPNDELQIYSYGAVARTTQELAPSGGR